jgi:hypothetical protein
MDESFQRALTNHPAVGHRTICCTARIVTLRFEMPIESGCPNCDLRMTRYSMPRRSARTCAVMYTAWVVLMFSFGSSTAEPLKFDFDADPQRAPVQIYPNATFIREFETELVCLFYDLSAAFAVPYARKLHPYGEYNFFTNRYDGDARRAPQNNLEDNGAIIGTHEVDSVYFYYLDVPASNFPPLIRERASFFRTFRALEPSLGSQFTFECEGIFFTAFFNATDLVRIVFWKRP